MVSCRSSDVAVAAIDASSPPRRGTTPDARREAAINRGLAKRLEQMADERARAARAAEKADAEFSAEFLNAAREVFLMIDKDDSGSLDREEIVASSVLSRRRRGRADCIERQKRHRAGVASKARQS